MNKSTWCWSIAGCLLLAVLSSCAEGDAFTAEVPLLPASQAPDESSATKDHQELDENSAKQEAGLETPLASSQQPSTGKANFNLTPVAPQAQKFIERAKLDLAQRLDLPAEAITVSAVIGGEFTSAAFYCQVAKERVSRDETPAVSVGQTILLNAGGRGYEYHASNQQVIFCRQIK